MLLAFIAFVITNTLCVAILVFTNQHMRNKAISQAADHSLLLDHTGDSLETDLDKTLKALDATYPYNHRPNLRLMIPLQSFISLVCFALGSIQTSEPAWLIYGAILSILGAMAVLDGFTTWLPRHYSAILACLLILISAFGFNAKGLTISQALSGALIAFLICSIANAVCSAMKREHAIADGDSYYLMAIGSLLGPDVIYVIFSAVLIHSILVRTKYLAKPTDSERHFPFGPAIFTALILILLPFSLT